MKTARALRQVQQGAGGFGLHSPAVLLQNHAVPED